MHNINNNHKQELFLSRFHIWDNTKSGLVWVACPGSGETRNNEASLVYKNAEDGRRIEKQTLAVNKPRTSDGWH